MRLLLADDHTLFRDSLAEYLRRADPRVDITLLKDLHEVSDHLEKDKDYDLVLLDLKMPGMFGIQGLQRIKAQYGALKVALMSGTAEDGDVKAALDCGAAGYLPKTLSGKSIVSAIRVILAGERFVPLDHADNTLMRSYYGDQTPTNDIVAQANALLFGGLNNKDSEIRLTPREKDVLTLLVGGSANKEIARALNLQVVTIKLHVRGICKKLKAKNRTHAALLAKQMGLIEAH